MRVPVTGDEEAPAEWGGWRPGMTLGQALAVIEFGGWACACIGRAWGDPPGAPCGCRASWSQVEALQRGAHIVARCLADAAAKKDPPPC
jgi:hypothetical protein